MSEEEEPKILLAVTECEHEIVLPLGFRFLRQFAYKKEYTPDVQAENILEESKKCILYSGWKKRANLCTLKVYAREGKDENLEVFNTWRTSKVCNDWLKREKKCMGNMVEDFTMDDE